MPAVGAGSRGVANGPKTARRAFSFRLDMAHRPRPLWPERRTRQGARQTAEMSAVNSASFRRQSVASLFGSGLLHPRTDSAKSEASATPILGTLSRERGSRYRFGMVARPLPYPPPWQDKASLCAHICVSESTVDNWVAQGILPPPRLRGGKLMWKWVEVDERLTNGSSLSLDAEADRIRENVRRELAEDDTRRKRKAPANG
jgi:hypothetical protein